MGVSVTVALKFSSSRETVFPPNPSLGLPIRPMRAKLVATTVPFEAVVAKELEDSDRAAILLKNFDF